MEKKFTKNDIVDVVSDKYGYTKKISKEMVDTVFDSIVEQLESGNVVDIFGLGKFEIKERKERNGINPATKEKIVVPAGKVVKFKVARQLKQNIN